MNQTPWCRVVDGAVVALALAASSLAQCGLITVPAFVGWSTGWSYVDLLNTVTEVPGRGLFVGGRFTFVGTSTPAMNVAMWNNGTWSALGAGVGSNSGWDRVDCSVLMPNGDVVVAGTFQSASGVGVYNIARWDWTNWHPLGEGLDPAGSVWDLRMVVMPNGDLVVAGHFYAPVPWLARWNGSTWSTIGGGGWEGISALAVEANGDLVVAFANDGLVGARVMRWNGSTWTELGSGSPSWRIGALHVTRSGHLIAGGMWPSVAMWSGTAWTSLQGTVGFGTVTALEELPNGDLVAAGNLYPTSHITRWNGATWQAVSSISSSLYTSTVKDLCRLSTGQLAVAGQFAIANSVTTGHFAVLSSTCAANAVSYGGNCPGSAGPVVLQATQWPMVGGAMNARTSGLPENSLAVGVFGFSQVGIPLSSGHPLGHPNCEVLVADEILIEFLVGNGVVNSAIAIPNLANLVGATFYHQVVPIELGVGGHVQMITSSNALALTVGTF
jgi:hypothetical protein